MFKGTFDVFSSMLYHFYFLIAVCRLLQYDVSFKYACSLRRPLCHDELLQS